ncbi:MULTISPECIES: triphosphoribosyl-dephospho-CoA synthase [Pandoraea]|uniref:triphosphoribosyl-dephospho-CoA synthase n=1 Tax=Pandoraea TaxID=93217 RepID=UPI001F5CC6DB|nr:MULTISPECIES: triphosphoribosyl-dephospho-CoA synthase [Pandoraea]MCI3208621.1 triphosphoribosyl-dephospho-CoA synthase MdcB [Pandoraea sp. LA3]MDN4586650.1 triphosphoribosyl-dephospho-CoA synthase MdcB [Pandoraea capi]
MDKALIRQIESPSQPIELATRLATLVEFALIDEVTLSPKPGLVDVRGSGSHHDLTWALMVRSANVLRPTFEAMARAGVLIGDPMRLREQIGRLGRLGEKAMLAASGGVNTHRGAIWALGLLITAAAQAPNTLGATAVARRASALARLPDRFAPCATGHKGERACLDYGVGGARGQAWAGFPHVTKVALPALRRARAAGVREDHARVDALLAVMATLDDTCVLARGGPDGLHAVQSGASAVRASGGLSTPQGRRRFRQFESDMLARHISPGGAADMLAAALFLDRLSRSARLRPNHRS